MAVTREQVMAALAGVALPEGGSLVSADLVRALSIRDGAVSFVIESPSAAAAKGLEPVRQAAERARARLGFPGLFPPSCPTGGIRMTRRGTWNSGHFRRGPARCFRKFSLFH